MIQEIDIEHGQASALNDYGFCVVKGKYTVEDIVICSEMCHRWDGDDYDMVGETYYIKQTTEVLSVQTDDLGSHKNSYSVLKFISKQ